MSLKCAICGSMHPVEEFEQGRTVVEIPLFYEESNLLPDEPGDDWVIVNIPHDVHDLPTDWDSVSQATPGCRCFRIGNQAVVSLLKGVDEPDNGEGYAACAKWKDVVNPLQEEAGAEYDGTAGGEQLDPQEFMRGFQGTLQGLQGYLPHVGGLGPPPMLGQPLGAPLGPPGPLRFPPDYPGPTDPYGAPGDYPPSLEPHHMQLPPYPYLQQDHLQMQLQLQLSRGPHGRPPAVGAPRLPTVGSGLPPAARLHEPVPVRFMGEDAVYEPATETIHWKGEEFSCNAWCKRVAGKGGQNWKRSIRVNMEGGNKRPKLYDYLHQVGMGIE